MWNGWRPLFSYSKKSFVPKCPMASIPRNQILIRRECRLCAPLREGI